MRPYRAVATVVFTEPHVASVGTASGDQVLTVVHRIEGGRLPACERPKRSCLLELASATKESAIVGAVALGPEAGEWIGQLTLAVRARTPTDIRLDTIQPFPSTLVIVSALQALAERRQGS